MNSKILNQVALIFVSLWLLSNMLFAIENASSNVSKLIDISGKQRMLSQRIAKDYLYVGKRVATSKAKKQLGVSLLEFLQIHKELSTLITDPEIHNLLDFVSLSIEELTTISSEKFNLDNAQLILDLSESMLEGNQYIVDSLKEKYNIKEFDVLEKAAKQRMLSQRIAKYYIAYQSGIKDENTVNSMKDTVKQFSENLKLLLENKNNTPKVNKKLKEIEKLWKIVHKFYNNIEKGGLPLIVFNTTDKITKKMDNVTKIYMDKIE
jgi:hypothetical protein